MNNIEPKPVKERSNLDLLELVCQLHSRALNFPSKEMHDAYIEARREMERRLQVLSDLPESKGSETDMGTKIEPEFLSWTETESGVTEKSNPQYGIYHFLKHWYYRVVAPCLKSDGWIPVSERLPEEKEVGKKVLVWRRLNESQSSLNPSIYNTNMVKHCDTDALWQPLPAVPQERGDK